MAAWFSTGTLSLHVAQYAPRERVSWRPKTPRRSVITVSDMAGPSHRLHSIAMSRLHSLSTEATLTKRPNRSRTIINKMPRGLPIHRIQRLVGPWPYLALAPGVICKIQRWPIIVQACASDAGRQLAADTAEVVFGSSRTIEETRSFYQDMKARVTAAGRSADHLKILPGALVIVGRTREEAQAKKALLDSLVHPESGVPNLSIRLGGAWRGECLQGH
jgi:hypothetical protein